MAVEKFKPNSTMYTRLLSDNAQDVRRSAAKVVREARATIHNSENLVARSREVVDRTEKDLKELKAKKARRTEKKPTSRAR